MFHLRTKIVMRTENGIILIHLCDKYCNEKGSIHATDILLPFFKYLIYFIMK